MSVDFWLYYFAGKMQNIKIIHGGIQMEYIEDAIGRIKEIECPTGEINNRVIEVLTDFEVAARDEIIVRRDHSLDKNGVQGYNVNVSQKLDIVVLAVSGRDDYVAKVIDAYIS